MLYCVVVHQHALHDYRIKDPHAQMDVLLVASPFKCTGGYKRYSNIMVHVISAYKQTRE